MRISDWSSDVCSSDLSQGRVDPGNQPLGSGLFIARGPVNLAGEEQARQALGLQRGPELTRIDVVVLDGVARLQHDRPLQPRDRLQQGRLHILWQIGRASCRERVCQYV